MAVQFQQKANQVRKAYEQNDLVADLVAQIRKGKALDWLLHHVEMVDPAGQPLDRDVILGHTHDEDGGHGHDHDHDHPEHDHVHVDGPRRRGGRRPERDTHESTEAQA